MCIWGTSETRNVGADGHAIASALGVSLTRPTGRIRMKLRAGTPVGTALLTFVFCVYPVSGCKKAASQPVAAQSAKEPARELTLDLGGLKMNCLLIRPGRFLMGNPDLPRVSLDGTPTVEFDKPQHQVTISKPFYLGQTPVTVDQFAAFVKDSGYRTDAEREGQSDALAATTNGDFRRTRENGLWWRSPSISQAGDHPVVQVSWNDATAFCDWLSLRTGKAIGLPTEAQWEYACRAGTKTAYLWGDKPDEGKGWANGPDQSLNKRYPHLSGVAISFFNWDDGYVTTSPVGSFRANGFGLYDMIGNVRQWCADRFGEYQEGEVADPTGAAIGVTHPLRGGSWACFHFECGSANRRLGYPTQRSDDIGFRVAVELPLPPVGAISAP